VVVDLNPSKIVGMERDWKSLEKVRKRISVE